MKKGMILLMAIMLAAPLTALAQHDADPPEGAHMGRGHFGMGGGDRMGPGQAGMRGGKRGGGIAHLLMAGDKIGLTDEQRDQLKQMALDHKIEMIDSRAAVKKAQVRLRSLMRDEDAAENDVTRQIDEVAGLKADLQKARYAQRKQIHGLLTEEQIDKIKELRKEHPRQMQRKFRGPRGQGRRGGWGHP